MYPLILAAISLALAALIWKNRMSGIPEQAPPESDPEERLRQALTEDLADVLAEAVQTLEAVMAHPELGGPGFLLAQFPSAGDAAVVTAQYPNIREALYRRIVRQELNDLPEELLSLEPSFETESGGVVLVSVQAGRIPPELREALNSRRERNLALGILVELLEERFPELSVRIFGTDLLLQERIVEALENR